MNPTYSIIHQWLLGLIQQKVDHSIIHPSFEIEDGMTLPEYLIHEQFQFTSWSSIHDVTSEFSIQILAQHPLLAPPACDKYVVFFYIINHLHKIVGKTSITILLDHGRHYIGSNNFYAQMIPKYSLKYLCNTQDYTFTHISLAIKSPLIVQNILSDRQKLDSFSPGSNFIQDSFYHARFLMEPSTVFNRLHTFRLIMITPDGQTHLEKRVVFFDQFVPELIPFHLTKDRIITNDALYPVNLSYCDTLTGVNHNHEYPRGVEVLTAHIDHITITDCLVNDWSIIL